MGVTQIGDRVLILEDKSDMIRPSGIILKESLNKVIGTGTVFSIGPGVEVLKKGDIVLFEKFLGRKTDLEGVEYLRFTEGEILGIVEEK